MGSTCHAHPPTHPSPSPSLSSLLLSPHRELLCSSTPGAPSSLPPSLDSTLLGPAARAALLPDTGGRGRGPPPLRLPRGAQADGAPPQGPGQRRPSLPGSGLRPPASSSSADPVWAGSRGAAPAAVLHLPSFSPPRPALPPRTPARSPARLATASARQGRPPSLA